MGVVADAIGYEEKLRDRLAGEYATLRERHGGKDVKLVPLEEARERSRAVSDPVPVTPSLLGTQVLTGGDKQWQTLSFTTREIRRRLISYAKFFFAVGGLEVKEVRVVRIATYE